jgi:hydroxymethylbilane synthase
VRRLVEPLHDPISAACVGAERAMMAALDGSCRTPVAGLAEAEGDRFMIEGLLLKPDGSGEVRGCREGALTDAQAIGLELGQELRRCAGPGFGLN